ncbi:hypothetical protein [Bradyrhizobium sp. 2S1]|uniref:hypothetical protein n=1 Tax=Bradyrhizobium sp. 2S1 TaxID=1404429 RepID=UPI00158860D8|nr:hypothetical protein [Bradyrhizobium sp. 2S1]MCK7672194.1 hypothetical protein [Bradyrhizobium sp. 2S1]
MPAIPQGFTDSSWHNDSCPNFTSEELGLRIWVDYADKAQREHPDASRFVLEPSDNEDNITDPICTDDWAVIIEAVEEERAEIVGCLAELEKADGAILHWQLDDKKFAVMLKRGLIRMEGDCLVHPRARKITELAFTMVHPTDMRVLYRADNEGPAIMLLNQLIANFNVGGGWQHRCNEEDMRHELDSRGWYSGLHDNGHYLVLNLHLMQLEPHPDHPRNETIR